MSKGRPKGKTTSHVRLETDFINEVKQFQKKKGIDTWFEAMKLYLLADKDWKKAQIESKEKIEEKFKREYSERLKTDIEGYIKENEALKTQIISLKEENKKIPQLESEIDRLRNGMDKLQKVNEKLKAYYDSDERMKDYNEMKEKVKNIPILEEKLKDALENRKVEYVFEDDSLPEYWPFDNMEEYKKWLRE